MSVRNPRSANTNERGMPTWPAPPTTATSYLDFTRSRRWRSAHATSRPKVRVKSSGPGQRDQHQRGHRQRLVKLRLGQQLRQVRPWDQDSLHSPFRHIVCTQRRHVCCQLAPKPILVAAGVADKRPQQLQFGGIRPAFFGQFTPSGLFGSFGLFSMAAGQFQGVAFHCQPLLPHQD